MNEQSDYYQDIKTRSTFRFYLGMLARVKSYIKNSYAIYIARKNGATIGEYVSLPLHLARKANTNLKVRNHSSIQTDKLDLRAPITIGSYVIIGKDVEILTCSHQVDSPDWEHKAYGIVIEDYAWIATKAFILPSCTKIERGSVIAAGAVVSKNIDAMSIMSGNPAIYLRKRKEVHYNLCVESLLGNDLKTYLAVRKNILK